MVGTAATLPPILDVNLLPLNRLPYTLQPVRRSHVSSGEYRNVRKLEAGFSTSLTESRGTFDTYRSPKGDARPPGRARRQQLRRTGLAQAGAGGGAALERRIAREDINMYRIAARTEALLGYGALQDTRNPTYGHVVELVNQLRQSRPPPSPSKKPPPAAPSV